MSEENEKGGTTGSDNAAIEAATKFWDANPELEAKAEREVPAEPGMSSQRAASLKNEYDSQALELEEGGEYDPEQPDGIPVEGKGNQQNTQKKQVVTGKPAAASTGNETPAETGLDPILREIALDSGWTPKDIDELYGANPEIATRQFERLADQFATQSRQFLDNPGVSQTPASVQQAKPAQVQQAKSVDQLPSELSDEMLAKFAEDNGSNAANTLKAMRDHFVARDAAREQRVTAVEQKFQVAETQAIAAEASSAISALQTQFPKLYGAAESDRSILTMAQFQKQQELAVLADQVRSGAMAQGRTISVKDAIKRAHYIVSRDSVKAEARKEIETKVRQRAKTASARPTQRQNPAVSGEQRSDDRAIAAAAEKMAEIGLNDIE